MPGIRSFLLASLTLFLASCEEPVQPQTRQGKMNISCFAYRDINRNGIFDLGDRPYAGLQVVLTGDQGEVRSGRSNIAGFANFAMSADNPAHPISRPGRYTVKVETDDGWEITSGNGEQVLEVRELPESPGGLVAVKTLGQVGIAPSLTLSGGMSLDGDYALRSVGNQMSGPDAFRVKDGSFSVPVSRGDWEIVRRSPDGDEPVNRVSVGWYPVLMPDATRPSLTSSDLVAASIDFDGLTTSDTLYEVPSGYGGLDWHNWIATHQKFYAGYGYINATTSGEFSAYNSSGHPAEFSSIKPFDLHRVNVGVAWRQAEDADIVMRGWRGNDLVYEDRFRASTSGPVTLQANYHAVTRVEIATDTYWQVVIDDLVVATH